MKLARHVLPLVVLQRHDPAQQAAVILAEAIEGAGEFVGFLRALANFGRAGGSNRLLVFARSAFGSGRRPDFAAVAVRNARRNGQWPPSTASGQFAEQAIARNPIHFS